MGTISHPAAAASTITISDLGAATANCDSMYLARHVITLDSMPTASGVTVEKRLLYTSPVGSCSVAETTKGTYESYECSNRGACDGKVVYAIVTKVIQANHAKHKQFWFKFAKNTSLNSKQKRNGIFTLKDQCIYIYIHTHTIKLISKCEIIIKKVWSPNAIIYL